MEYFVLVVFGILTGIAASLFGFGGGFIIVPLIYYLVSHNQHSIQIAVATSISVMIVNSLSAIYKHHKKGNILWKHVFPIAYYIALGSIIGSVVASYLSGQIVRYLFILYLLYTILNCTLKRDFIKQNAEQKTLSPLEKIWKGTVVGIIASALGVGGSILTVPLMRRLGLSMKHSVALANPLSLPVAVVGGVSYILLGIHAHTALNAEYLGFIYLPAFVILSVMGLIGVPIGARLAHKVSDALHAKIYIALLIIATIAMIVGK